MKIKRLIAGMILVLACVLLIRVINWQEPANHLTSSQTFIVYFASEEGFSLVPEIRVGEGLIHNRLEALVEGPRTPNLVRVFPHDTRIIGYQIIDDLLYVNFNQAFVDNHPGGSLGELLTVYGLVNSVTEDPQINKVVILVEGKQIPTLAGHLDLLEPLSRDQSLIAKMQ